MSERRGPEYVRPEVWQAREGRRQRRLRWIVVPAITGVGLAIGFGVLVPGMLANKRLKTLLARIPTPEAQEYHAIERRAGEATGILREEYVDGGARRYSLLDGEIELVTNIEGGDVAYERSAKTKRIHRGALISLTALERLMRDCQDLEARVSGYEGGLRVELPTRRYDIVLNDSGLPRSWRTWFLTDRGFEPLWETSIEYSPVSADDVKPTVQATYTVDMMKEADALERPGEAIAQAGDIRFVRVNVNKFGDLSLVVDSPQERPYLQAVDAAGNPMVPIQTYANAFMTNGRFRSESVFVPMQDQPVKWPLTFKIKARTFDPRVEIEGRDNREVGACTLTLAAPTCSIAPSYWFDLVLSDRPYFDFLRTRSYRRATSLQNAMRTKDNRIVDVANGGAVGLPEESLKRSPVDATGAIIDLKTVARLRAEYDSGTLPIASLYAQMASIYIGSGQRSDAKAAIEFAADRLRTGRADSNLAAEIERIAKEIE